MTAGDADAHFALAVALHGQKRLEEAVASYDRAIALAPQHAQAHCNKGVALRGLGKIKEALESYDRALHIAPNLPEAHYNKGALLQALGRIKEAADSFARAAVLKPDFAEAHHDLGASQQLLGKHEAALAAYDRAIALRPGYVSAQVNRAGLLQELKRHADAMRAYEQVYRLAPNHPFVKGDFLHAKMMCCDWTGVEALHTEIRADVAARKPAATPFGYLGVSDSEAEQRTVAEVFVTERFPPRARTFTARPARGSKIRLGYLCGEFRNQATSVLMTELYELHDKSRFELVAFDNGFDDGSALRTRIENAFDRVIDIAHLPDQAAAELIDREGIDILVNLNGYFGKGRTGVFSLKPSPLQVNFLGFPGTMGAPYMDYLIADKTVIPDSSRSHYSESIVHLPHAYQPNDRQREIAGRSFSRQQLGLPADGFVFCCFNNNYKIVPGIFDLWMRLLKRVDGSVLWLLENNPAAAANLKRETQSRGIDPARVVFAGRAGLPDHLARHRAADLFLDTLPYNAHTTASDALWAGLPLLTCRGHTFAGRVAASLLQAVGLPELIAENLVDYENLALALATDSGRLAKIRDTLAANRLTTPLFDSGLFTRHIEEAYVRMHERERAGLPHESFDISP